MVGAPKIVNEAMNETRRHPCAKIYVPLIRLGTGEVNTKREGLVYHRDPLRTWSTKIQPELIRIAEHNSFFSEHDPDKLVDVIVFPELSVPAKAINLISDWSNVNKTIVIAGSHYEEFEANWCSVCPVIIDGSVYKTYKAVPSPFENPGLSGIGLQPGPLLRAFHSTRIGNFSVLICSDYLDDEVRRALVTSETDVVFIIACQSDVEKHYSQAVLDCQHSARGLYVVYSNLVFGNYGSGRSALFAQVHRDFEGYFRRLGYSDLKPPEKVWQSSTKYPVAILSIDLLEKRPGLPKTTRSRTNVDIFMPKDFQGLKSGVVKSATDRRAFKLVAFDYDGTLLRHERFKYSWAAIWEQLGGDTNGIKWAELMRNYLRGKITYREWCDVAAQEFRARGVTVSQIIALAKEFTLVHNTAEVLRRLKGEGYKLVLLSGGVDVFLKSHLRDAYSIFDVVHINELTFDMDGVVHSVKATSYDFDGKRNAIHHICESDGIPFEDVLYVGDSINDESLLNFVGCFVSMAATGDEKKISMTANFHITKADLEEVYKIITLGKELPVF